MYNINLDSTDRTLLNLLQVEFPLSKEPYTDLGLRLDIDEDGVLRRIKDLKARGIVRQISPVLDARSLGYQATLVAIKVADSQLAKAARFIVEHPGISHGYERDHHFNLWLTLSIPNTNHIETELQKLAYPINAEAIFALPATKLFKIGAYFPMDGDRESIKDTVTPPDGILRQSAALSQVDRLIINELQQDLPLITRPFTVMSERLSIDIDDFLVQCQSLKQRGIIRRFGAAINHRRAGYTANPMVCWKVPQEMVNIAGKKLASLREVSHCYERKTNPLWQYNLFAIIHGHTREECKEIVSKVSNETGLSDYILLFSTKELKKTRVKYLV